MINIMVLKLNLKIFIYSVVLLIICSVNTSFDQSNPYKRIFSPYYDLDSNIVFLKTDSVLFDGYMLFKINKQLDSKFIINDSLDNNCIYLESFWINNLSEIEDKEKHFINLSTSIMLYFYSVSDEGEHYYDYSLFDSSSKEFELYKLWNSNMFKEFKLFMQKYNYKQKLDSLNKPFLSKPLTTELFDDKNIELVSYKDNDLIGYYLFKCSFYTSELSFKAIKFEKNSNGKYEKKKIGYIKIYLPISAVINFETVKREEYLQNYFSLASWKADWLFIKNK